MLQIEKGLCLHLLKTIGEMERKVKYWNRSGTGTYFITGQIMAKLENKATQILVLNLYYIENKTAL